MGWDHFRLYNRLLSWAKTTLLYNPSLSNITCHSTPVYSMPVPKLFANVLNGFQVFQAWKGQSGNIFSDPWLIEPKSNVLRGIRVNIQDESTLSRNRPITTQPCVCVWSCVVVPKGKVKSACRILPPINSTPRSCPSRCLSPLSSQQTCKHYRSPSLHLSSWLSLSHSLNHHQKATEETPS